MTLRASALLGLALVAVLGVTACSSSKKSETEGTTTAGTTKSPIVVKTPVAESQWRSPISVKGTTSLDGELTVEVLDSAGKQLGSKHTSATDGHFSVTVPFTVEKLIPGAVLVHDEHSDHSVQVSVVLTP